jgi:DNA-binding NtrC family response regulator
MKKVLISWVGTTDLKAADGDPKAGEGPVCQAVQKRKFDEIHLLCNFPKAQSESFRGWIGTKTATKITWHQVKLTSPTNFNDIHREVTSVIDNVLIRTGPENTALTFHLSPGTPAMTAVFVLLSKTGYPAELIQTSREKGLEHVSMAFDLSAEFLPDLLRPREERVERLAEGLPPEAPEFDDIKRSPRSVMNDVIMMARRAAPHKVPVLIEGESGTGKELMARAIHAASGRKGHFIAVNCGAIPRELVESELFGHIKGSFSGATADRKGHFVAARDGTLFLDEIGELPLDAQVKVLRAIQEGKIVQVGTSNEVPVNVRILAATHKKMAAEVGAGRFREDLFYRLAVMVLRMPPLRERPGDLDFVIDGLFDQLYTEVSDDLGGQRKKLSREARAMLHNHSWPGNARELRNTLLRALIWSTDTTITARDMRAAIMPVTVKSDRTVLNRPLGNGFNLEETMTEVARHYLERALEESHGVKAKATELVGLPSYQTFTNWVKKYNVATDS